ncbi:hypothetical protein JXA48_05175 [Candidatus Woesearchaeota archaeon]|nr:hypothetical protein [Candidatus Woesearchaeota archaeon]
MKTHKILRVTVTKEQYDSIQQKASYYGFTTMSAFIRDALLKDIYYQRLLREIHEKICK